MTSVTDFPQRIVGHVPARGKECTVMATVEYKEATRVYPGTDHAAVNKLDLDVEWSSLWNGPKGGHLS